MDSERARRVLGLALIAVAVATVVVWAISQFIRPLLPPNISAGAILFFVVLVSTVGVLAGFKGIVELVDFFVNLVWRHDTGVYHNLPQPTYERFIGRQKEIETIQALLSPSPKSRHFVITIDGVGGVGKSALALEVAYLYLHNYKRLPKSERFQTIIWTTAKKEVLTGGGILPQHQRLHTLDDIHSTIASLLNRTDILKVDPLQRSDLVRHALTQRRTLLIVDNFETIDDETIKSFIQDVPEPTKVIVTTRHRLDIAYPIRLTGMRTDEAREFVEDEAKRKHVQLTADQVTRLIKRTGGIPLALVWSIARIGLGYNPENIIERLAWATDDVAKFCFEDAVNQVRGQDSYKLLMTLAYIGRESDRQELGIISGLSPLARDEGLALLEQLSLINKRENIFYTLPLTLSYIKAELDKDPQTLLQLTRPFLEKYLSLVNRRHEYLETIGIRTPSRQFDFLFVAPVLSLVTPSEHSIQQRVEPLELVSSIYRAFVVGSPGSGKTTLLKYLALQAARGNIDLVPIFIQLRTLLRTQSESLFEGIVREFGQADVPAAHEYVEFLLKTGRAVLLLDGLDEIPQLDNKRQNLVDEIEDLVLRYPECRIVITSRTASVNSLPSGFSLVEVGVFEDAQIENFINSWFADAPQMGADLFLAIKSSRELEDLAKSPLSLSLLCSVQSTKGKLSSRLVDLYADATELLLRQWDRRRNIQRDGIGLNLSLGHILRLHSLIAAEDFARESRPIDKRSLERPIINYLSSVFPSHNTTEIDGEEVLQLLESQYGFISEVTQGMYGFISLGFQEYFTALHYSHRENGDEDLAKRIFEPRWQRVLVFYCGMHSNPTSFLKLAQHKIDEYLKNQDTLGELVNLTKAVCREEQGTNFEQKWLCVKGRLLSSLMETSRVRDFGIENYIEGCETFIKCLQQLSLQDRDYFEQQLLLS